jgi:hypothetical protein
MPNLHSTKILGDLRVTGLTNLNQLGAVTLTGQLTSTVATGTAPLVIASTTAVANLNADLLDGIHAASFLRSDTADTFTGTLTYTSNSTMLNMDGGASAEGIRMQADSSTTYPVFLRSINPASSGETSAWLFKETVTDWGIWHNNPLNAFDFTRSDGVTGIATDVGGSTTNVVMIRLNAETGQGTFAGPLYASINQRVFADNYHPNADILTTARTLTIGSTGKTFNGSANVSWSLAEIGAQPAGSYLITESDTLQTVTTRGGTTDQDITIEDATFSVKTTGVDFDVNNLRVTTGVNSNISGSARTVIISGEEINFLGLDANNSDSATILKNTFALGAFNNGTGEAVIDMSAKTKITVTAPTIDIGGTLNVSGNLTINGTTTTLNARELTVDDKNIELGSVVQKTNLIATLATGTNSVTLTTGNTSGVIPGQLLIKTAGTGVFGTGAQVGAITSATVFTVVNAAGAALNHATAGSITFSIEGASDASANGGGITLKGTTDKTIQWLDATDGWHFNQNIFPSTDNTGVVGNSTYAWSNGHFTNLTIDSTLSVRGAIDLADSDRLRLGSSDDWEMYHTTSGNFIDLNNGNLIIRDDGTSGDPTRFTFERTTGNLTAGGTLSGTRLISTIATGTAPLTVTSTTAVANLNADLLDGLHATDFLNLSTGGSINVDSTSLGTRLFVGSSGTWTNRGPTGHNGSALFSMHTHPGTYYSQLWFDTSGDNFYHRTNDNGALRAWRKVWHEGNDGSGSGLDADLLDGNHASAFYLASNPSNYASGTVTGVTGTAPIASSGGTAPVISITAATQSAAGSMSAADKAKLDGIASGATANSGTITGVIAGTGLSGGGTTGTVTLNHSNAVTAATVGPGANATLAFGGTFTVPQVTYDAQGHITAAATRTFTMPANPNTDTLNTAGSNNSTSKLFLVGPTSQTTGSSGLQTFSNSTVYTTNGTLFAPTFAGGEASGGNLTIRSTSHATKGTITLDSNTSVSGNITLSGTIIKDIAVGTDANILSGTIGSNDFYRIRAGGASNAGYLEIATADDASEPIHFRQYTGVFTTLTRTATILDGSGNTSLPGTLTVAGNISLTNASSVSTSTGNLTLATAAGNGNIILTPNGSGAVTSAARLGLGTTAPGSVIHVKNATPEIKLEAGSTTDSGTMRYNSTTKSIEFIFA